jgi:hypothetical protein
MIQKDSITLLESLFNIEFDKFLHSKNMIGQLSKQSKMDDCEKEIIFLIESYPNSVFLIMNSEKNNMSSMTIIISNIDEINSHSKKFIITIASSCETFKVERQSENNENIRQLIKDFDKNKL